jgi:hypothetical protein
LLAILAAIAIAGAGCAASQTSESAGAVAATSGSHPQAGWAPCNRNAQSGRASAFRPLSSGAAAALVAHQPETRPFNARQYVLDGRRYPSLNSYVPTRAELRRFRRARLSDGRTVVRFNPYLVYVDGRDGLRHPSTDDLIQWGAHKWGIPEDWLRAEYVQESYWNGFQLGDQASVGPRWYAVYPPQARVPGSHQVFESMGITQVKWRVDGSVGAGTEPLRWESTAFNIDYQAAMVRFYYDNPSQARSAWGDASYAPCQAWRSVGGWFSPYPWGNSGQAQYAGLVQQHLASRAWALPDFVHWAPDSSPPGVRFR